MLSYSTIEQWSAAGRQLAESHDEQQFSLGQWLAAGESFGKKQAYKEAARVTGINSGLLKKYAYTYRNTLKLREAVAMNPATLTWTHYRELAKLDDDLEAQKQMFNRAVAEKMTVKELAEAIDPPESFTQGNDPLTRLAYLRNVSVAALKDAIIKEYLARPEVVAEMAEADAKWAAAEFTTAPDQESEEEKRARVIFNAAKEAASSAYRLAKRADASNEVAYRLAYNSAHEIVIMNSGDGFDAGTIALRAANAVITQFYKDSKAAAAEEPAPAPEPESVGV